ncbi:hypothetical protein L1887_28652 [Cichorium endivia]|nr:hypothetical protein L1887_28652 [Cichorium endivia]
MIGEGGSRWLYAFSRPAKAKCRDFRFGFLCAILQFNDKLAAEGARETGIINLAGVKSSPPVDLTDQINQLPCCIKYDGPFPVSHYFKPKPTGIEVDGVNGKEAYFRGRKLQGTIVHHPDAIPHCVLNFNYQKGINHLLCAPVPSHVPGHGARM